MKSRLISHESIDDIFAYQDGNPIFVREFLADVDYLVKRLPAKGYMLNACKNRYHFTVALASAATLNQSMLLPPNQSELMLRFLLDNYSGFYSLSEEQACSQYFPHIQFQRCQENTDKKNISNMLYDLDITDNYILQYVFTSGSTGEPTVHGKTWGKLVINAKAQFERIKEGLSLTSVEEDGGLATILATVPAQHMYGFESSVLLCLQSGFPLCAEHPFHVNDICNDLQKLPRPRVLVSTPYHLQHLMQSNLSIPPADLVLSATAPLALDLAKKVESAFSCSVQEIYGCSETGQLATRYPTQTDVWETYNGIEIEEGFIDNEKTYFAKGGHIEKKVALGDNLQLFNDALSNSKNALVGQSVVNKRLGGFKYEVRN